MSKAGAARWAVLVHLGSFFKTQFEHSLTCEAFLEFLSIWTLHSCTLPSCLIAPANRVIIKIYCFHIGVLLPLLNYEIFEVGSTPFIFGDPLNRYIVNDGHSFRFRLPMMYHLGMHSPSVIIKLTYRGWMVQLAEVDDSAAHDVKWGFCWVIFVCVHLHFTFSTWSCVCTFTSHFQYGCPVPDITSIFGAGAESNISAGILHQHP